MSFIRSTNYVQDTDNFTPPNQGGPVAVKYADIYLPSGTVSQNLFTLPAGAVVTDILVNVPTAVVGTDVGISLGNSTSGTFYASKVATGTVNTQLRSGFRGEGLFDTPLSEDDTITGVVTGTTVASGTLQVCFNYITRTL